MASDWFIRINNAEHGPFTSERLKLLAQQGKVTPETPLKSGVAGHWLPARQLKGLFPAADSHGAPATAAPPPNRPVISPSVPRNAPPPTPAEQMEEMAVDWLGPSPENVAAPIPRQVEKPRVAFDGPVAAPPPPPVAESHSAMVASAGSVAPDRRRRRPVHIAAR